MNGNSPTGSIPPGNNLEGIGASMILPQTRILTQIRTTYFSPNTSGHFDAVSNHRRFLQALKEASPTLEIIPNDPNQAAYSGLSLLPLNETSFRSQFEIIIEARENGNRITVCHAIRTRATISDTKFKLGTNLLSYLRQHDISLTQDQFNRQRISSVGFFIGLHPDMTHRIFYRDHLKTIINDKVDLTQQILHDLLPNDIQNNSNTVAVPDFELIVSNINYGSDDDRISTRAIDVLVATPYARLLKAILAEIDFSTIHNDTRFIGRGYMHMNSGAEYRDALAYQNNYINKTICFSITGLAIAAYNTKVTFNETPALLADILASHPAITNIYPTTETEEKGKWLILTTREQYIEATKIFDDYIQKFYNLIPNTEDM